MSYRDQLVEERDRRYKHKDSVLKNLHAKKTMKSFIQALSRIEQNTKEIVKIDRILKDGRSW